MALDTTVPAGLEALVMTPAQLQAYKQNLVNSASMDINREAGNSTQAALENAFARGVGTGPAGSTAGAGGGTNGPGLSSISAYNASLIERARADAIQKASLNADAQVQAAQRAALGEAASYVSGQQKLVQNESQFSRELQAKKQANTQNMLMQGLGGLAGGALKFGGNVFGKDIADWARNKVSGGGTTGEGNGPSPIYGGATPASGMGPGNVHANEPYTPDVSNIAAASPSSPDLSGASSSAPSYDFSGGGGNYSGGSAGNGFGGMDFTNYNPQDYGFNLADLLRNDSSNSDWSF
jgi:hypothetical protein